MGELSINVIRLDGGTQPRSALYENVVAEYAEAIGAGAIFPPVVVFFDGTAYWLADGFHRVKATAAAGRVDVEADILQGTRRDAILYSVGANDSHGLRRTNDDKRRAVLTLLSDPEWSAWSDHEIARRCSVSHPLVARLRAPVTGTISSERRYTTKHGTDAVMDTEALKIRAFDPHQAREHIAAAKFIRAERQSDKAAARDEKEAALADKIRAGVDALNQGRFGVILADPPWRFEPYSRETGMDRAADNHYPTMAAGDIAELQVPAADDCVLFLWATSPMLTVALHVMAAWGFDYKSQIIWVKDRIGTGYWARNKHELLLIGTRGEIPAPAPGTQPDSAIVASVGVHSEKPEIFHEIIERLFPNLPKIEMFSRRARSGWHGWGAEAESFDPDTGEITEPAAPATTPPGAIAADLSDEGTDGAHHEPLSSDAISEPDKSARPSGDGLAAPAENVTPIRKQWAKDDKPHPDCLKPELCGGFSNLKVCQSCREAAQLGQVA